MKLIPLEIYAEPAEVLYLLGYGWNEVETATQKDVVSIGNLATIIHSTLKNMYVANRVKILSLDKFS